MPHSSIILPFSYNVELNVTMPIPIQEELTEKDFTYNASVEVIFMVMESTNTLELNVSSNYEIEAVTIEGMNISYKFNPGRNDIVITTVKKMIQLKTYLATIVYKGKMTNNGKGFYWSSYTDENYKQHYFAATNFNPHLAHTLVPCFDEPDETAVWSLTIKHSALYNTIFNSKPKEETYVGFDKTTTFGWTAPTSPHRISIFISELDKVSDDSEQMVDLQIHGEAPFLKQCKKPLISKTQLLMKKMKERFGIRYPLFKLDLILVPNLKRSVSNFGVISLASNMVENETCPTGLGRLMAEQWLGNHLVPDNWTQIVMVEAFSHIIGEMIEGKESWNGFELQEAFLTERNGFTLTEDPGMETVAVLRSNERKFKKGILIFDMIRRVFGDAAFYDAVLNYVSLEGRYPITWIRFAYYLDLVRPANVTFDVTNFLRPYFTQPGIPLLHVDVDGDFFLVKVKYVASTEGPILKKTPVKMMVPFTVISDPKTGKTVRKMAKVGDVIRFRKDQPVPFFNPNGREYYLVHYAEDLYKLVGTEVNKYPQLATKHFLRALRVSILFSHKMEYGNHAYTTTEPPVTA
uniref:Peptidase_M1_N domain-containing protein n=1 Tax=Panagrellus redivivus TaxID=6233 RepID=A0A7E4ZQK0_PANRE